MNSDSIVTFSPQLLSAFVKLLCYVHDIAGSALREPFRHSLPFDFFLDTRIIFRL